MNSKIIDWLDWLASDPQGSSNARVTNRHRVSGFCVDIRNLNSGTEDCETSTLPTVLSSPRIPSREFCKVPNISLTILDAQDGCRRRV